MKITIFLGTKFDGYEENPLFAPNLFDVRFDTPKSLIEFFCNLAGVYFPSKQDSYLRINQFQQKVRPFLLSHKNAFFADSFQVAPFETAKKILDLRDELVLGGFDLATNQYEQVPSRIKLLQDLHTHNIFPLGFADSVQALMTSNIDLSNYKLVIYEPLELLEPWFQNLLQVLKNTNLQIDQKIAAASADGSSDLSQLKKFMAGDTNTKQAFKNDGSVVFVKGETLSYIQESIAHTLSNAVRPTLYLPANISSFDSLLKSYGLPTFGAKSISKGRPLMQLFRTIPHFIWNPIDITSLLEFTKLPIKPLSRELSGIIEKCISNYPGIGSEYWNRTIHAYFDKLKQQSTSTADKKMLIASEKQYKLFFDRKRYEPGQFCPIKEVLEIISYYKTWAKNILKTNKTKSLHSFIELAIETTELLENIQLTTDTISRLALEQVIDTLLEPVSNSNFDREKNHVPVVMFPQNILKPIDELWWVGFYRKEQALVFDFWNEAEKQFFEKYDIAWQPQNLARKHNRWCQQIPFRASRKKMVFFIPSNVDGETCEAHPFYSLILAAFGGTIDTKSITQWLADKTEKYEEEPVYTPVTKTPFIHINTSVNIEEQSFTNLLLLLTYPHNWFLKNTLKIKPAFNTSVQDFNRFKGNFSHRLLECFFKEGGYKMAEIEMADWLEDKIVFLLPKEGALFLEYGKKPSLEAFKISFKKSLFHLINYLKTAGWDTPLPEQKMKGSFENIDLKGRSDLILQRGNQSLILDFKWQGKSRVLNKLKNNEDFQLQLYAHLLGKKNTVTSYYIINSAELLSNSRNSIENRQITSVDVDETEKRQHTLNRLRKTIEWRTQQLDKGNIEIRTKARINLLEDHYQESLLDLIELSSQNYIFDDYLFLLGEIN